MTGSDGTGRLARVRFQAILLTVTCGLLLLSFVNAGYLREQPLHHIPTLIGLFLLARCVSSHSLGDAAFTSIILFI